MCAMARVGTVSAPRDTRHSMFSLAKPQGKQKNASSKRVFSMPYIGFPFRKCIAFNAFHGFALRGLGLQAHALICFSVDTVRAPFSFSRFACARPALMPVER